MVALLGVEKAAAAAIALPPWRGVYARGRSMTVNKFTQVD
jgi:hypothetical protein